MVAKLYVKRGGAASISTEVMTRPFDIPRKGGPAFNGQQSPISMGMAFKDGESSQGMFTLVDPEAEIPSSTYRLPPHGLVTLTEDASGDEIWLARNRIGPLQSGRRGEGVPENEIEWDIQSVDCNIDLTGNTAPFRNGWVRPAETDIERLVALQAFVLNGSSSTGSHARKSTEITVSTSHLVNDDQVYNLPAHTYAAGTVARDVIADIAERAGKFYGIVIHHTGGSHLCLEYVQELDHATYLSPIKISQHMSDWNPDDPDTPVFEPKWDRGKGTNTDNNDVISGLVSIYGGTDTDPNVVFVDYDGDDETPHELWDDIFYDDKSENVTEATNRAQAILDSRRAPGHRTHQLSIKMHAEQCHLLTAGMSLDIKSAVVTPAPLSYVKRRITELKWEPAPDGDWFAHIDLDKPLRRSRSGGSAAQPAATVPGRDGIPTPKPECDPDPDTITPIVDWSWLGCTNPSYVDPFLGGAPINPLGDGTTGSEPFAGSGCASAISSGGDRTANIGVVGGTRIVVNLRSAKYGGPPTNINLRVDWGITNPGDSTTELQSIPIGYWSHEGGDHGSWRDAVAMFDVPPGVTWARFAWGPWAGWVQNFSCGTQTAGTECPDDSIPTVPGGGTDEHFARFDDPRFTAADQHETTRISRTMTNVSGAELAAGAIVISSGQNSMTTIAEADYSQGMIGFTRDAVADTEDGQVEWFGVGSLVPILDGPATAGDFIYTSATPGVATTRPVREEGAVGKVIVVDGSGIPTFVEWWGIPDGPNSSEAVGPRVVTIPAAGASETLDLDGVPETVFDMTLDDDCLISATGFVNGQWCEASVIVHQDATGGHVMSYDAPFVFPAAGNDLPTDADTTSGFGFGSLDGGTTIYWWALNSAAAALVVREVGGSDIDPVSALEFDADDFVVTDEGSGVARVALAPGGGSIWRPVMAQDPSDSKWYVVVDGTGTAVMAEG